MATPVVPTGHCVGGREWLHAHVGSSDFQHLMPSYPQRSRKFWAAHLPRASAFSSVISIKNRDFGARLSGFKCWLCLLLAVWTWANFLTSVLRSSRFYCCLPHVGHLSSWWALTHGLASEKCSRKLSYWVYFMELELRHVNNSHKSAGGIISNWLVLVVI